MLYTKCILKPRVAEEGTRISIMSGHTLQDGKTPDPRITSDLFDEHIPELAPSRRLLGDYYKRGLDWPTFERCFLREIEGERQKHLIAELARRALAENITLLCIEDAIHFCHRRLVAERCKALEPSLAVVHV